MLISTEKRFLFVHVPKTAGASVTSALRDVSHPINRTLPRRISSHLPLREAPDKVYLRGHDTARWARVKLGRAQYDALHSFAVVRNPFDLAFSHYKFLKEITPDRYKDKGSSWSFLDFLRHLKSDNRRYDQSNYVTDLAGEVIVDRILRFETLAEDFERLAAALDLPARRLPTVNATSKGGPSAPYCDEAIEKVRSIYAPDFDLFGYATSLPTSLYPPQAA